MKTQGVKAHLAKGVDSLQLVSSARRPGLHVGGPKLPGQVLPIGPLLQSLLQKPIHFGGSWQAKQVHCQRVELVDREPITVRYDANACSTVRLLWLASP